MLNSGARQISMNTSTWNSIVPTRRMDDWIQLELDNSNSKNKLMHQVGIRQFQQEDCD